ncbi:MAG: hypothetical protein L6R41_002135 [Letrouitia leprolyta]|nr:MAG: hypothetical protein L6R41_002135 [Letrouitia leprolyta]
MAISLWKPLSETPFPFERLPQELQTKIIQETMPHHGLLPWHSFRLLETEQDYVNAIPYGLFLVNKSISKEARYIVQKEVYFVIEVVSDIGPDKDRIKIERLSLPGLKNMWSHSILAEVQQLRELRNFKFDLLHGHTDPWTGVNEYQFHFRCMEIEEKLRLICDALTTYNTNIQNLVVQIPCLCSLEGSEDKLLHAYAWLGYILEPLRRLKVAQPVAFYFSHHDAPRPPCTYPESETRTITHNPIRTRNVERFLEHHFGALQGEPLSKYEQIWKDIKARDRDELYDTDVDVAQHLWELFTILHDAPDFFRRYAASVGMFWNSKLRFHRESLAIKNGKKRLRGRSEWYP